MLLARSVPFLRIVCYHLLQNHYRDEIIIFKLFTLSFLSVIVWISLVNFKQGISLVIWVFSLFFQGFRGFGRGGKSLVNLGFFLGKNRTIKERKDRVGDYSYSFQGSSELINITATVSLFF